MNAFATREKVEYAIDDENAVFYRGEMTIKTRAAVERELIELRINRGDVQDIGVRVGIIGEKLAYLSANLVRWRGPMFEIDGRLVPCKSENIRRLSWADNQAWIEAVVDDIKRRNQVKTADASDDLIEKAILEEGGDPGDPNEESAPGNA